MRGYNTKDDVSLSDVVGGSSLDTLSTNKKICNALMAGVAQLVELWIVIPVVEGSIPFARPISNCSRDNNL